MIVDVRARLDGARRRTHAVTDAPDAELTAQHSTLMSPLVWDLAHVGQQEEHWLLVRDGAPGAPWLPPLPQQRSRAYEPVFAPEIASLYDAFEHPRATRTSLPLLSPTQSRRRLADVRGRVLDLLDGAPDDERGTHARFVGALVAQHEAQHVETMLATHQLRAGPPLLAGSGPLPGGRPVARDAVLVPGGPFRLGADPLVEPFALDNEVPQHEVDVPAFRIGRVPVTSGEWMGFIAAGGYTDPRWWSAEGWAHRCADGLVAPRSWSPGGGGGWLRRRFGVVEEVPPDEPVQHVDFFEASAYARWAGARLPTEVEWEKACAWDPALGRRRRWPWGDRPPDETLANLAGNGATGALRPAPVGAYPAGASAYGVEQMIGDVWEWTASIFTAWPGFRPMLYRAYSQPFFAAGYQVLRGGSWATDPVAVRPSFRNWDLPIRRQIFCGLRLAWDA